MAFDPSVISQIGPSAIPDFAGAQRSAYQLKDLMDTEQIHSLQLKDMTSESKERDATKSALMGSDLSTSEGRAAAVEKVRKSVGGVAALELMGKLSAYDKQQSDAQSSRLQVQKHLLEIDKDTFDNYKEKLTTLLAPAAGLVQQYDDLVSQGVSPSEAQKQLQPAYAAGITQLRQSGVFSKPEDEKKFQEMGPMFDIRKIRPLVTQSQEMQKALNEAEAKRSTEKHQRTEEGFRAREVKLKEQGAAGGFSPEMGDLMAALSEKGVSIPAGFRSKAQQAQLFRGLLTRNQGKSADEIADLVKSGQIEFGAEKKETQTAAGIAGRVAVGENELIDFAPKALAISDKVPRGRFVPANKLIQMGQANISDPDLKELTGRTNAILNAYDVVAARGGTDMKKREENRQNLLTADSPQAYRRAVETMLDEAKIAKGAARKAEGRQSAEPQGVAAFSDAEKERRYQEWKRTHGG